MLVCHQACGDECVPVDCAWTAGSLELDSGDSHTNLTVCYDNPCIRKYISECMIMYSCVSVLGI